METLLHLITEYGLLVVFVSVLLDQGGIPVPAYPPIMVTSALAVEAGESVAAILVVATLAAVVADSAWYAAGRRLGTRMVRLMCRLSLSPDSCVRTTRGIYARWGPASLTVAKFVPGFAAVATTLAGETRTSLRRFFFFDGIGALLWSAVAVALGVIFHDAVGSVLERLEELGRKGLMLVALAVVAFIAWKWLNRQRVLRQLRMARISPMELYDLMQKGAAPLILDARSEQQRAHTGWIPGAVFAATPDAPGVVPNDEVIIYCDCPNEASAALLARDLKRRGFKRVRPLTGGFEAWRASGHDFVAPGGAAGASA
jgi:membrane protein DedA with SNARE-associated domain/rhodanese-related sulfurtransferase